MDLRADPASIAPERAIVFEVASPLPEFYRQAAQIGLEFLADDESVSSPDEDFRYTRRPEKELVGRIYVAMPDVRALRELVRLWRRFQAHERMDRGFAPWTSLFKLLRDVRPWGPQDRVLPETIRYWQESVEQRPNDTVRFEAELWFRQDQVGRELASTSLRQEVAGLGGVVVHSAVIPEIRYHAALIDVPAIHIQALLANPTISLAQIDDVMFLRPQTVGTYPPPSAQEDDQIAPEMEAPGPENEPIAALLDGFPVQNHQRLRGRLTIDDPDGLEDQCPVVNRAHGTAMASLIIHGDLNRNDGPLSRTLYVRPVLSVTAAGDERTPPDQLVVDVIYRAIRRIKEGEGEVPASAPTVLLINLSLGDENRPYARQISPWARLIDFLAFQYRVLFVVSAGNIKSSLPLDDFQRWSDFEDAQPSEREKAVLKSLNAHKGERTLLSPAEALNAITVGAAHRDAVVNRVLAANALDPLVSSDLPNVSSALGLGHRKTIKPEILLDGGREFVRFSSNNPVLKIVPLDHPGRSFGLKVATPDSRGGDLGKSAYTSGTSAAAALATRAAHRIHDVLMDDNDGSLHADVPFEYQALLLKALLVHGANWGERGEFLDEFFEPRGSGAYQERRDDITRLLGYGFPDFDRVIECAANRATLLGFASIRPGDAHIYQIPLPHGLDGVRGFRGLTSTLAWFSPVNPRHQAYRAVALDVDSVNDRRYSLGVRRMSEQPVDKSSERGTIVHEHLEGLDAVAFDTNGLLLRVSCRATAGEFDGAVPYSLAVSIEVGVESTIQVYDEIRAGLAVRVRGQR